MRVFISHSSADLPAVEKLAASLHERGIQTWLDRWELSTGSDFIARINRGLEECTAIIIAFSAKANESVWVQAEVSYAIYARIQEGKLVIPVKVTADAAVPPLLRPLIYRGIEEHQAIADAVEGRTPVAPPVQAFTHQTEQVLVTLTRSSDDKIQVETFISGRSYGKAEHPKIPASLLEAQASFLAGIRTGLRRSPAEGERHALESGLAALGHELGALCLTKDSGPALADLLDGAPLGTLIDICFETADPELLALPFEALRLPDNSVLAVHPAAVVTRRVPGLKAPLTPPLPGPLKILVAVGAPDEDKTSAAVLDLERELQNILDAVTPAQRHENCEVRILEVGHPKVIASALKQDAYHVLHLSCHGLPGALELEDEEGRAVRTTATELLEPLRSAGRPLPMVLLNSCHGGVQAGKAASFAQELLRAGVPAVLAMQTSVSDHYATQLARAFYEDLRSREHLLPSRALAEARRNLETARRKAIEQYQDLASTQPEYATATLFLAGAEQRLANFGADKEPLHVRPVYNVAGPVPQLRLDDLIGRRKELRETLRALRDPANGRKGVVLTGIGGTGKSAVAGRAMQRLSEDNWKVPAHAGRIDLGAIAVAIGVELLPSKLGTLLANRELDDQTRFALICKAIAEERIVLVLDDFEQNLTPGGDGFLDSDVATYLAALAQNCHAGRLLITCRHPLPGMDAHFLRIPIGPLSPAETRKLVLRLDGLKSYDSADLAKILRVIGGHPRMLEFLDALLRDGQGRLPHVTDKLQKIKEKYSGPQSASKLEQAIELGARDVLLTELLEITRREGIDEALLQTAVSNLPVTPDGLSRMLAESGSETLLAQAALTRLETLSLVHRFPDGSFWVHRWTAQGLAQLIDPAKHRDRHNRAGRYRLWRVQNESRSLDDAVEAVRNFLAGEDYDSAAQTTEACIESFRRAQRSVAIASLASEVLEKLPESHGTYGVIADEEAMAHLALGFTDQAFERYGALLALYERRAKREPDRADVQSGISTLYIKIGDLYHTLGQTDQARQAFLQSLVIAERLANAEPDRADFQRDLSLSYERIGDFYLALGQTDQARHAFVQSLAIREQLANAEPDRADFQRDLSVSYNKIGDLYSTLGQTDQARQAFLQSLAIRERLAKAEPDRADFQRDLSVSYNKIGDIFSTLGQTDQARQAFLQSHNILERLANAEPDRADYQRDLSISYEKIGDLYSTLGQTDQAREYYLKDLAIAERLANAEPDRADFQRDLSVSYNKIGDLYSTLGQTDQARQAFLQSLAIRERLANAEPDRADFQRDLFVSHHELGTSGGPDAKAHLRQALAILEALKSSDRLAPVDEQWLTRLREMLGGTSANA